MKRSLGFRAWHGVVSVAVAAALGVVINLVTDGFTWTMAAAVLGLVAGQAALSVWQGRRDQREARDALLGPLRPEVPDPGLVFRLTAPFSPTPLWGRAADRDRLVAWCADPSAGVARVITGPAGVGKSRLALAVAEALPEGWVAGRLLAVDALVERIAACGDPTLVIVEDADRVTGLDVLLTQAARHPDLVRIALLTRDLKNLHPLPDVVLPHLVEVPLTPVGEPSDRERWFAEAVRAYAKALGVPPPDLSVGNSEDSLLLLHARALLAVLGRSGSRDWSLRELATELVSLEQRTWKLGDYDTEVLAEALTVLALTEPSAEALRHVPQFAHDSSHESRTVVARWARRRHPLPPLLAGRLLVDTLTRTPELFHENAAIAPLAHAYATFPDALDLLLDAAAGSPARLEELFATGVTGRDLDHGLASRLPANSATLTVPRSFPHVGCAVGELEVSALRPAGGHALAVALDDLGDRLHTVGRFAEALEAHEESVAILRALPADPADLASALTRLGRNALELGDLDRALAAHEEAVAIRRGSGGGELVFALGTLAVVLKELGRLDDALAASSEAVDTGRHLRGVDGHRFGIVLENHGMCLLEAWLVREGIEVTEEAVETFRRDPFHLATALKNLGYGRWKLGELDGALAATEEAVVILTGLAATEPDRYDATLSAALLNHAGVLRDAGRFQEAHAASFAAVSAQRRLTSGDHQTGLAGALGSHGTGLLQLGRVEEALPVFEEAAAVWPRQIPSAHFAAMMVNRAICLWLVGRPPEALAMITEAADTLRTLTISDPVRTSPGLATALTNLGGMLQESGRLAESEQVQRECVAVLKACAEREPGLYGASYATAQARLRELTG